MQCPGLSVMILLGHLCLACCGRQSSKECFVAVQQLLLMMLAAAATTPGALRHILQVLLVKSHVA